MCFTDQTAVSMIADVQLMCTGFLIAYTAGLIVVMVMKSTKRRKGYGEYP